VKLGINRGTFIILFRPRKKKNPFSFRALLKKFPLSKAFGITSFDSNPKLSQSGHEVDL